MAGNWPTKFSGRLPNPTTSDTALLYGSFGMRHPEGTIIKRGKRNFRARITLRGQEFSKTHSTAGEAEQWLLNLRLAADEDDVAHRLHVQQLKVSELLIRFRDEVAATRRSKEARRREVGRCNCLIDQQTHISGMKAIHLQPRHIVRYIAHRRGQGASNGSIRAELAIIRRTFTLAGGPWGLGLEQPVRKGLMPPPPPSRERRLSQDEYKRLLDSAYEYEHTLGGKDRIPIGAIIEFAIQTAMRRSEIATLTWDRVVIFDDGFGIATLPQLRTKTATTREVPLTPELVSILLLLPSAETRTGLVFGASYGGIGTAWNRVLKIAGLFVSRSDVKTLREKDPRNDYGLRMHDLRHEGTSRFFERYGLQKILVQSITGHSSEAMADRYAHLEARPLVLRQLREVYAKLNPTHLISDDIGRSQGAGKNGLPTSRPAAPAAVKVVNPRWKTLKRNATSLSEAVWAQPIADLADALGISDVAVHKACKKLGISKPPRGHWLKDVE